MNKQTFETVVDGLFSGQKVSLLCRGEFGDYRTDGVLYTIVNGRLVFQNGEHHHFSRIISIAVYLNKKNKDEAMRGKLK